MRKLKESEEERIRLERIHLNERTEIDQMQIRIDRLQEERDRLKESVRKSSSNRERDESREMDRRKNRHPRNTALFNPGDDLDD